MNNTNESLNPRRVVNFYTRLFAFLAFVIAGHMALFVPKVESAQMFGGQAADAIEDGVALIYVDDLGKQKSISNSQVADGLFVFTDDIGVFVCPRDADQLCGFVGFRPGMEFEKLDGENK